MTWTPEHAAAQTGRIALVTGANSGIGYDTALALAGKGAQLVLACRHPDKAQAARAQILLRHPQARIDCLTLDLGRLDSVRAFAREFTARYPHLDLLINNAGIMMPPYALSADGFESQLAVNYLGHFALTGLLLGHLDRRPGARIVSLASLAHTWGGLRFDDPHFTRGYNRRAAYGQSKLACLMFAYELDRRLRRAGSGTLSVAAHPGITATNLTQYLPRALTIFLPLILQPAAAGALPTLYAALGEDIAGGDYCGPRHLGQMRGAPVKVGSNRASRDEAAAQRLWALSETLTGVRFL